MLRRVLLGFSWMISAHVQDRSKLLLANGPPCKPNCRSTRLSPKNDEDRAATFSTGLWWNMAPSPGHLGSELDGNDTCSVLSSISRVSCAHNLQNEKMDTGVLNQAEEAAAWTGIHDDEDALVTLSASMLVGWASAKRMQNRRPESRKLCWIVISG